MLSLSTALLSLTTALAADAYVMSLGNDTIYRVDLQTGAATAELTVPNASSEATFAMTYQDGLIYTSSRVNSSLAIRMYKLDAATGAELASATLDEGGTTKPVHGLATTDDGGTLLGLQITNPGSLFVIPTDALDTVDDPDLLVADQVISAGSSATRGMTLFNGQIFANTTGNTILVYDLDLDAGTATSAGSFNPGFAVGGISHDANNLLLLDITNSRVVTTDTSGVELAATDLSLGTVTGLAWIPTDDSDSDGVPDADDLCLYEDATGFDLDGDGCLDDSDGDGVTDDVDPCPDEGAGDIDGDGCPDDSDGDGTPDSEDTCEGYDDSLDADLDGVPDGCDACDGDDLAGDTDGDLVCDDLDACEGDDLYGDSDSDGVCDDLDVCGGDDASGDADLDGVCADSDQCDDDADKTAPGDCGCGAPDEDLDSDGVTDCLEGELGLSGESSHVRFHSTRSFATFSGAMELGGGLLAPDLRDEDYGYGAIAVAIGETSPVSIYDESLTFDLFDPGDASGEDNREKWQYRASSREKATLRWKNSQRYSSQNDPGLPSVEDTDNLGRVKSRFIHADESRLRVRWNGDTQLPLTITLDGVPLLTVVDNGDSTYTTTSAYEVYEVYKRDGDTERKRVVDVVFPDRIGDGNVMAWYLDGDADDGLDSLLYSHEIIDDGTAEAVFYNAGGRFHVVVPLDGSGLTSDYAEPSASLTIQVGTADTPEIVEGSFTFSGYAVDGDHWRLSEIDEDGE
jgi:hypothetical protein